MNDPPVAFGRQLGTPEDTPLNDFLRASDVEGNPLTFTIVSQPVRGTVQVNAQTGTFIFTPKPDDSGTVSFTFKVNDGTFDSNVATVFITVQPVNDVPIARNDAFSTLEDTDLSVFVERGVLGNDTDVDSTSLTAVLVAGPSKGSLTLNPGGTFTYRPFANINGTDSFTYKVSDGSLFSNVATVTLTVTPVNDAPVARNDAYATAEDTPLTVAAPGVLGNDTDVDSPSLSAVLMTQPSLGTLTLNSDGSFVYTPNADANGTDSFTYMVSDGSNGSNVATVTLTVEPVNDTPVAQDRFLRDRRGHAADRRRARVSATIPTWTVPT